MKKKGFTLIELLIAITIFSVLIALATYSFRLDVGLIKRIFMPYPEDAVKFSTLNDIIKSMFFYVGVKKNIYGKKKFFIYFYGIKNNMRFISMTKDGPKLFMLSKKNRSLQLKEARIYSRDNDYKNPFFPPKDTKVKTIFNDVDNVNFSYYINNKRYSDLKEKVPTLVKISITRGNTKSTYSFKIESTFNKKLNYAEFFHSVYQ